MNFFQENIIFYYFCTILEDTRSKYVLRKFKQLFYQLDFIKKNLMAQ